MTVGNNIKALGSFHPSISGRVVSSPDPADITAVESRDGGPVPVVEAGGKKFFVHSRFDPVIEAERLCGEIDAAKHDLVIVFGFGYAYHVEALLAKMGRESSLLVIEKRADMIKSALGARDLSGMLSDHRLMLLVDPDEEEMASSLRGKSSLNIGFVTHRGSHQLYPDYYSNMFEMARSYVSTKEVNIATLAKFEKIWSANIARNAGRFVSCPGANIFYGKFNGAAAIVVAAGPSLPESIEFIRRNSGRAVIIAVDTAYKILERHGIAPHFCLVVDPQVVNARYFEGVAESGCVLVADPTVHPSALNLYRGRIAMFGVAFKAMKWIEDSVGEKGEVLHGGSVSTNAYDFARRIGAGQVIMVGQDLGFTRGLAHARGSYLDEQMHLKTSRTFTAEMFNRRQLSALPPVYMKGIRTARIRTNQKMLIFMNWFERRNDPSLFNATFDGVRIPGVKQVSQDDVEITIEGPSPGERIEEILASVSAASAGMDVKNILSSKIRKMLEEIDSLVPVLRKAVDHSESLCSLMKKGGDRGKIEYLVAKLSDADRAVESRKSVKEMIGISIQKTIHTITEGYDLDESDAALTEEQIVAKRSNFLYRGLLEGSIYNRKILLKMERSIFAVD
ncbi:MAG: DUF115 domain-containing protein [Spirochaetes bacterium]|jgi:hypothetical protein|nr:DUF115 domain-containing protein [Spirochaetota bacterium]